MRKEGRAISLGLHILRRHSKAAHKTLRSLLFSPGPLKNEDSKPLKPQDSGNNAVDKEHKVYTIMLFNFSVPTIKK